MQSARRGPPVKQGLLHRPRIDALLEQGIRHSLLTVVAGWGYGKTQAVASYARKLDKALWLNLNAFDNLAPRFW